MSPSPDSPTVIISVEDLHRTLQQAHLIGNLARRKFLEALLAMNRARLYLLLGFPSFRAVHSPWIFFRASAATFLNWSSPLRSSSLRTGIAALAFGPILPKERAERNLTE